MFQPFCCCCCCTCTFFHSISFRVSIYLFFAIFFHILLISLILYHCSLLSASFYHYLVFQGLLQFMCCMFRNISRLKLLQVLQFLLIHYFYDWCLLLGKLELSYPEFLFYPWCSPPCPVLDLQFILVLIFSRCSQNFVDTVYHFLVYSGVWHPRIVVYK